MRSDVSGPALSSARRIAIRMQYAEEPLPKSREKEDWVDPDCAECQLSQRQNGRHVMRELNPTKTTVSDRNTHSSMHHVVDRIRSNPPVIPDRRENSR